MTDRHRKKQTKLIDFCLDCEFCAAVLVEPVFPDRVKFNFVPTPNSESEEEEEEEEGDIFDNDDFLWSTNNNPNQYSLREFSTTDEKTTEQSLVEKPMTEAELKEFYENYVIALVELRENPNRLSQEELKQCIRKLFSMLQYENPNAEGFHSCLCWIWR